MVTMRIAHVRAMQASRSAAAGCGMPLRIHAPFNRKELEISIFHYFDML